MGKYGFSTYGVTKYGEVSTPTVGYSSNLSLKQIDYKTVSLEWQNVVASSGESPLTHWKIIKSTGGAPDQPNDGKYVVGGTYPMSTFTYVDVEDFYKAGTEVTYSFWVFDGSDWIYCDKEYSIVVEDNDDTTLRIMRLLPGAWTSRVDSYGSITSEPDIYGSTGQTDLYKFLSGFGYYYDYLRQRVGIINSLSDYRHYPSPLLANAVSSIGLSPEPTLGDQYNKSLYKAADIIHSFKGSRLGLRAYVDALTHFKNTFVSSTNLLLDYNQSSFEETTSTWKSSQAGVTLSSKTITTTEVSVSSGVYSAKITTSSAHGYSVGNPVTVSVNTNGSIYNGTWIIATAPTTTTFTYVLDVTATTASASNSGTVIFTPLSSRKFSRSTTELGTSLISPGDSNLTTPSAALVDSIYKPRNSGYGLVASAGTGDITLTSYSSTTTTVDTVPVSQVNNYQFFGYARKASTNTGAATIKARIDWFDRLGVLISSASYGTSVTLSNSWQYFESSSVDSDIKAPINAVFAGITVVISGSAANDRFFLDFLSFNTYPGQVGDLTYGSGKAVYEDARTIKVLLKGVRTNFIVNPSFEDTKGGTLGGWSSYGGTISSDSTTYVVGTRSCKLTATTGTNAIVSNWIPLDRGANYMFSAYVKGPNTSSTAYLKVEFATPKTAVEQAKILKDQTTNEAYFNNQQYSVSSTPVTLTNANFQRLSISFQSPEAFVDSSQTVVKVSVVFPNATSGSNYNIDACLLEEGLYLYPFFLGNGGVGPSNTNLVPAFNPLTDPFAPSADCQWEKRVRANFISNPSFESGSTTGYSTTAGATLTSVTAASASISSLFGTYIGKVVQAATSDYVSNSFVYPSTISLSGSPTVSPFPYGGEEITFSAYVYGPAGDYSISAYTENVNNSSTGTFSVAANTWTRIHVTCFAEKATSTTPAAYVRIKSLSSSTTWYFDGVQAEFGNVPSPFVDPADTATLATPHPKNAGQNIYVSLQPATGGGRSYYWPRLVNKLSRLKDTLPNYTPVGSSFSIIMGDPRRSVSDITNSILKSSSFESSLYGWNASSSNTKCQRVVGRGTLYSEIGALSSSWVSVQNATTSEASFGIYQESVRVAPATTYYFAAAARIDSSADVGTVTLKIDWYDSTNTLISTKSSNTNLVTQGRWVYCQLVDGTSPIVSPTNAAYAKVTLTYAPTTRSSTNKVSFDQVVLKDIG